LHVALYLNPHTLPHLPSVIAGRQVVERSGGTGTLVPRTRHEHVVNMGRRGHARVSDLVTQISQGPLSPISAPIFLQSACLLSLILVRAAKRVPYHVLVTGMLGVMDGRVVSRGLCSCTTTPRCNLATSPWSTPHRQHMPHCAPEHALSHHPLLSITSRSFHPFYAIAAYLGMIMPFLVLSPSHFSIIILCATTLTVSELVPCKCLISASPLPDCGQDHLWILTLRPLTRP
jgi:hypothetical protein